MKLDEGLIKELNLNPNEEREPINVMRMSELLAFIKESAERIVSKSNLFFTTESADIQADCLDIVAVRLNDFVQAFIDVIIFLRKEEGTYNGKSKSLRYCISGYDTLFSDQTSLEKQFLGELLLRNEITHDYFNREIHQQKLIALMQNCAEGSLDVYKQLSTYIKESNLLEKYVNKSEKH
jgi:hypothetical protein